MRLPNRAEISLEALSGAMMMAEETLVVRAVRVAAVPTEPSDGAWRGVPVASVPLNPQNVVIPKVTENAIKTLRVRTVYDDASIAFLIEWDDPTREAALTTVGSFRDAVAIQFPAQGPVVPPFNCMGSPGAPVAIYQWKSDWEAAARQEQTAEYPNMVTDYYPFSGKEAGIRAEPADYAKAGAKAFITAWAAGNPTADPDLKARTSVERLVAEGFGTIESDAQQDGHARGTWEGRGWRVVITIPRPQGAFTFQPGPPVPVAFAVWDGRSQERNGRKGFSVWYSLQLEERPEAPLLAVTGGLGAAVLAALGGLLWFRRRQAARRPEPEG